MITNAVTGGHHLKEIWDGQKPKWWPHDVKFLSPNFRTKWGMHDYTWVVPGNKGADGCAWGGGELTILVPQA